MERQERGILFLRMKTRARTGEGGSERGGTIAPDGGRIIVVVIYVDARESKYYKRHYGRLRRLLWNNCVLVTIFAVLSLSVFLFARALAGLFRYPFHCCFFVEEERRRESAARTRKVAGSSRPLAPRIKFAISSPVNRFTFWASV